ncbi:hypothetical protein JTE90_002571 [Oedothorax gibbosus]|uniref:THAP-type domain-containing protein n=1 Tax=Oedothorax gibbosus TaxID=931172 RepID=A0AAV6TT45_9ARAC|nr:hypothetical protein JTE90_002571 [Oedothorax gibbosus]
MKLSRLLCLVCQKREKRLYKLPKDNERMKKWLQLLSQEALLTEFELPYLVNNARLCGDHFSDWAFANSNQTSLIKHAYPILTCSPVSHDSIPSEFSTLPETQAPDKTLDQSLCADPGPPAYSSTPKQKKPAKRTSESLQADPLPSFSAPPNRSRESQIILNQRSTISRLRKKLSRQKQSLLVQLREKLTEDQYDFVCSQIRQAGRNEKGRRWTNKEKAFALNIYLHSPAAYKILRRRLHFPHKSTLRRFTLNVVKGAGFCPNLLKCLKTITKKMKDQRDRLCILCWDEMAVKEGLTYCPRRDCVEGLETSNVNPEQVIKPLHASHALVFMARGVKKNWKQVLGYFFTSKGASKNVNTVKWVTQSIDILKGCNLKVIATVCDQGPANLGIYRDLGATVDNPFFMYEGEKIFTLYDPPHLLKSTRNNFKNHGVTFLEKKVGNETQRKMTASWDQVEKLYEHDKEQKFRICPKLSLKHVRVPGFAKLSVKLAAQVCIKYF